MEGKKTWKPRSMGTEGPGVMEGGWSGWGTLSTQHLGKRPRVSHKDEWRRMFKIGYEEEQGPRGTQSEWGYAKPEWGPWFLSQTVQCWAGVW